MRVAALQFDVRRGDVAANLAAVERGLEDCAERGVRLVLLPEVWPTSFVADGEPAEWVRATEAALARVAELSRALDLVVAGSALAAGEPGEPPRNRLTVFDRGEVVLAYDKLHLFSPTAEHEAFSAGRELPATVTVEGARLSGVVCYDLRFAVALRRPFVDEAEILLVPAQWPTPRRQHLEALVRGRAAELQAFVVAANRTGVDVVGRRRMELAFPGNSMVVGPDGAVLAMGEGREGPVVADLDLGALRALRKGVPVRRDERRDLTPGA